MVADFCHVVLSLHRPERRNQNNENMSDLSCLRLTRKSKYGYFDWSEDASNKGCGHENFQNLIFVLSPVKFSSFRLAYRVFSWPRSWIRHAFFILPGGEDTTKRNGSNQPPYLLPCYFQLEHLGDLSEGIPKNDENSQVVTILFLSVLIRKGDFVTVNVNRREFKFCSFLL